MVLTIIKRFLVTEDFFEFNLKCLFIVGLWPDENVSRTRYKLYKIYERTLHCFMLIFLTIAGIKTFQNRHDVLVLLSDIDIGVASYNYFFKVVFFVVKREKLKNLVHDIINSGDKVTDVNRDNMMKLLVLISSFSTFIVSTFSLAAFFNNEMSVNIWLPFDPFKNKMSLTLALQIVAGLFIVPFMYRAMGMQGMICSLLIYLCDQLEDMQKRIRELQYTKQREAVLREELKRIIRKHIRLLGYANSIESMFKEYFLIQNFAVTLELCLNAVLVTTIKVDHVSVLFQFIIYLGLALLNAFIYSSLGDELIKQSKDIAQAVYDSNWTSWPVDLQKNLLIIITVAQRPFKISAGGMVVINMQSFGTALYNGYSIFAVLSDAVD